MECTQAHKDVIISRLVCRTTLLFRARPLTYRSSWAVSSPSRPQTGGLIFSSSLRRRLVISWSLLSCRRRALAMPSLCRPAGTRIKLRRPRLSLSTIASLLRLFCLMTNPHTMARMSRWTKQNEMSVGAHKHETMVTGRPSPRPTSSPERWEPLRLDGYRTRPRTCKARWT